MIGMDGKCPFEFNYDPSTFKSGDTVSYRVPKLGDWPFVATIVAVYDDYVELTTPEDPQKILRATRESRPVVSDEQALS